jgi:hypothetical protein
MIFSKFLPAVMWAENSQNDGREGLAYPFAKQMDTKKSSLPRIVRRRALLRMRHRKRSKAAVKRTVKAQIAILILFEIGMRDTDVAPEMQSGRLAPIKLFHAATLPVQHSMPNPPSP